MAESSDEEYNRNLEKYTNRLIKKVSEKNPISRSQQFAEEVREKLKKKGVIPESDYSEDEIKKGNKKKRGKKFAVESDEEKPPKKRGRPPKSASKPKELKSKKLFSDSDSDDEPPRKIKKLDKKDKHAKKCRDSDESDGDNRSRFSGDGLYFDWSPQDTDPKAVTRFDQHLGYGNRLILCNYKKRNQLHFRKYTPEGKPTTQGITLPLAKLHIVKRALEAAETHAKAEGVFAEEKKKSG